MTYAVAACGKNGIDYAKHWLQIKRITNLCEHEAATTSIVWRITVVHLRLDLSIVRLFGRSPGSAIPRSELVADAQFETPRHDVAAVRRQDRSRIALGQRILVRDVVAGELHDKRLVELQD
jgi:hypothetical protein